MLEKSRLEELSAALPETERKELLERIMKRMEQEESEEAVPVELAEEERSTIITYEMKKASWWVRFLLWLRTFFSGRSRLDVFLEIKLGMLKAQIRAVNPGLTGFETRDLTPKFARRIHDLHERTRPLVPVYQTLMNDKAVRAAAFTYLVETRFPKARKEIGEFITLQEMEEAFTHAGDAEEIRKKLSLRMNEYIRSVPESLFAQWEDQAKLHLYLGKLSLFPFSGLFRYFNYISTEDLPEGPPVFEHAPVMLTLDLLEKLYTGLVLVRTCQPDYEYPQEPLAFYLFVRGGIRPQEEKDFSKIDGALNRTRDEILELCKDLEDVYATVPILDIIRFFRKDPYYTLTFNPPHLYLRNLYFTTLKGRIEQELEEKLEAIKEQVINNKMKDILKNHRFIEFSCYKENPGFDFRKMGLPVFSHVRSLVLTYNYLVAQYKGWIQEAVQVVSNTALVSNRITQNRLTLNVSGLEDLEAKILLFDRSLSPDEEDGKQLARFRFTVATDMLVQKTYRALVAQKDREAKDLVEKTKECLSGVKKIFDELRTSTFENTRSLMKTLHVYKGKSQALGQILNARSEGMGAFLELLDQLLELEKGT